MNTKTLAMVAAFGLLLIGLVLFSGSPLRKAQPRRALGGRGGRKKNRRPVNTRLGDPDVLPIQAGTGEGLGMAAPRYVTARQAHAIGLREKGFTEQEIADVIGGRSYSMAMVPYPEDVV